MSNNKKTKKSNSRKTKESKAGWLSNAWSWLSMPDHKHEKPSTRKTASKRSVAYCHDGTRRKTASAYKVSRGAKKTSHHHKNGSGVACICGMTCVKEHKHNKTCHAAVECVCAKVSGEKHHKATSKRSTAYKNAKVKKENVSENVTIEVPLLEKPRKSIPKLRSGTLRKHGFSSGESEQKRHEALSNAVKEYGPTVVLRKLNVIATLNKNRNPELSNKLKVDSAWVKTEFGTTARPK